MIAGTVERLSFSLSIPVSAAPFTVRRTDSFTGDVSSMYGLDSCCRTWKNSSTLSCNTEGAKGRKDSRNLIFTFIVRCMLSLRASPRMLRLPSARGPNSIRPWHHPTTFSDAICLAT